MFLATQLYTDNSRGGVVNTHAALGVYTDR